MLEGSNNSDDRECVGLVLDEYNDEFSGVFGVQACIGWLHIKKILFYTSISDSIFETC